MVESLVSVLKNSLQRSCWKMCLGSPSNVVICGRHKMPRLTSFFLSGMRRTVIPSPLKLWISTLLIMYCEKERRCFFLSEAFAGQALAFLVSLSYFIENLVKRRKVDGSEPHSLSFTNCSKLVLRKDIEGNQPWHHIWGRDASFLFPFSHWQSQFHGD